MIIINFVKLLKSRISKAFKINNINITNKINKNTKALRNYFLA